MLINKIKRGYNYKKLLPCFWIIALSLVLLLPLLSKQEFWTGYDTYFHMNGIYEDAMQIKTGHFSYFLSLFGFEQSGRIVNSLYGPIFNYLCGTLLLLCHSWIRFEFWLFFITMVIGGCGVYKCAKAIHVDQSLSTILTMFYLTSEPVILVWISNFEFIGLGATILLPYVVLMGIKIFQQRQIRVIPLAILMSICLQIHLMTAVITILVLAIFTLGGFIRAPHKVQMIKRGCSAALLAFCLSGNIFGAIYDVYSTNHLIPTFPNFNLQRAANHSAICVMDLHFTELGGLYTFFLVLIIILMIIRHRTTKNIDWCLLTVDLIFLWLSSAYFPWDRLVQPLPWLASVVQFPSRFMAVSFLTTLLLMGRELTEVRLKPKFAVIGLAILFLLAFNSVVSTLHKESVAWNSPNVIRYWVRIPRNSDLQNGNRMRVAFRSRNLSDGINVAHKVTADYMPTPGQVNLRRYYHYPIGQEYNRNLLHQKGFHKYTSNHTLLMSWHSRNARTSTVPLVKYRHTVVRLNHRRINPERALIGTMKIKSRPGINRMKISYQPRSMFKFLSFLTVVSWLIVLLITIKMDLKLD